MVWPDYRRMGSLVYSCLGTNSHYMVFRCGATLAHPPLGSIKRLICRNIWVIRGNNGAWWSSVGYRYLRIWWIMPLHITWGTDMGDIDAGYFQLLQYDHRRVRWGSTQCIYPRVGGRVRSYRTSTTNCGCYKASEVARSQHWHELIWWWYSRKSCRISHEISRLIPEKVFEAQGDHRGPRGYAHHVKTKFVPCKVAPLSGKR